ncbi:TPA: hypothetical protein RTT51_000679 [Staphylococcus aureus]|uniref:hypothetical protein n=1 Tax=Staphylococcus aureus TaxID=1280 RepID=UPI00077A9136|nr:hypothetical protein [Staphylococcus aureus]MBJ6291741.1 hypothetical protein [Staphylococcus aureus]MCF7590538.1 hypothetical protein [Staphylococcus aureus]MDI1804861.1 hypothetical protein [Staphylococcus aureus]MDT3929647.1 hypothetical protein [Staphylococcus aureus]HCC5634350.1 hypothetical protein [Staphylococcus aureus]
MRIKVKKTMTLSELIEWAWENPELTNNKKIFARSNYLSGSVKFSTGLCRTITTNNIMFDDEFEVAVEEEVTKDTVFDKLFEVYEFQEGDYTAISRANISINKRLDEHCFPIKAFYILNDDLTMTLIWKDGELVE